MKNVTVNLDLVEITVKFVHAILKVLLQMQFVNLMELAIVNQISEDIIVKNVIVIGGILYIENGDMYSKVTFINYVDW